MDSQKVPLKAFAKSLGFRGYSRFRKAVNTAKDKIMNILSKPTTTQPPKSLSKIRVPILKPTVVTTTLKKLPNLIQKTSEKVINWGKWLKNVDKMIEPTFTQVEEQRTNFYTG